MSGESRPLELATFKIKEWWSDHTERSERRKALDRLLEEIAVERQSQINRFGEDNGLAMIDNESNTSEHAYAENYGVPTVGQAKGRRDLRGRLGIATMADVLIEEVCEALEAASHGNNEGLRKELIQVAAVCVACIQKLDRESGKK